MFPVCSLLVLCEPRYSAGAALQSPTQARVWRKSSAPPLLLRPGSRAQLCDPAPGGRPSCREGAGTSGGCQLGSSRRKKGRRHRGLSLAGSCSLLTRSLQRSLEPQSDIEMHGLYTQRMGVCVYVCVRVRVGRRARGLTLGIDARPTRPGICLGQRAALTA